MDSAMTIGGRQAHRTTALLWVLGPIWYLLCEAVAAAAFPGYDYAHFYISDLGVPVRGSLEGRDLDSPLAAVMNAGFIGAGLLFLIGLVTLLPLLERGVSRVLFALAGFLFVTGIVFVGLVPGSAQNAENGLMLVHVLGATAAIGGGNLAAIASGWALRQEPRQGSAKPDGMRLLGLICGVFGLFSFVMLNVHFILPDGVWERAAVYPFFLWQFIVGVVLLRRRS